MAARGAEPPGTRPVDAASVVLVRERDGGFEVLLLERHLDSDFAGGALVFPGGKVDAGDRELPPERWRGADLYRWATLLGAPSAADALGLLVAAVRETFEEAGVLLAVRADGTPVRGEDLRTPSFVAARTRLAARHTDWDWRSWLQDEGLVLDLGSLTMWAWWVTPRGQHKRFDTRFLLARLPEDQRAAQDEVEMTALRWLRPADALAAQERGEAVVIFPTRRNLHALSAYGDADSLLRAARDGRVDRRRIEPSVVHVGGQPMVQHPDEDQPEPI